MADENKQKNVHLKIPGDPYYLGLIRKVIVEFLSQSGIGEEEAYKVEMAVDEACANVMEHAYSEMKKEKTPIPLRRQDDFNPAVDLDIKLDKDKVSITIRDYGEKFDFEKSGKIDLDKFMKEMRTRGLGVFLIKNLMDSADYTHKPGLGNELKLVKYLK